jgi:hypothetical protein
MVIIEMLREWDGVMPRKRAYRFVLNEDLLDHVVSDSVEAYISQVLGMTGGARCCYYYRPSMARMQLLDYDQLLD